MEKLTRKQRIFIDEYLKSWNASDAAKKAGYSQKTARFIGAINLTKVNIRKEIDARLRESHVSTEEALKILGEQSRSKLSDFFKVVEYWTYSATHSDDVLETEEEPIINKEGEQTGTRIKYFVRRVVLDMSKINDPFFSSLLEEFSETPTGPKIKLQSKQGAIDKILRVAGAYKDTLDINVKSYAVDIEEENDGDQGS